MRPQTSSARRENYEGQTGVEDQVGAAWALRSPRPRRTQETPRPTDAVNLISSVLSLLWPSETWRKVKTFLLDGGFARVCARDPMRVSSTPAGDARRRRGVTSGANAWGCRPHRGAHLTRAEVTSDILVLNHRSLNGSSLPRATCQQVRSFLRWHLPVCPRRADERRSPAPTWGPLPGMHFPEKAAHVAFTAGLNVPFPRVSVTQPGFYMSPRPWAVKSLPGSELDVAALRCIWAPSVCEAALTSAQTLREPR